MRLLIFELRSAASSMPPYACPSSSLMRFSGMPWKNSWKLLRVRKTMVVLGGRLSNSIRSASAMRTALPSPTRTGTCTQASASMSASASACLLGAVKRGGDTLSDASASASTEPGMLNSAGTPALPTLKPTGKSGTTLALLLTGLTSSSCPSSSSEATPLPLASLDVCMLTLLGPLSPLPLSVSASPRPRSAPCSGLLVLQITVLRVALVQGSGLPATVGAHG
eukprot:CAMPEP_0173266468 /NCGR_PEP_ID=MMETSP1142-20121109/29186_1 /TAXON_ID=483371 /ORGANISM="non described non described, Strain CCMP2298" /LENGTH=222 /DNA_ID=CAMNT_0014202399 /DNA_START=203 /DNA_END=871 /DNA_ORIENTATION=+